MKPKLMADALRVRDKKKKRGSGGAKAEGIKQQTAVPSSSSLARRRRLSSMEGNEKEEGVSGKKTDSKSNAEIGERRRSVEEDIRDQLLALSAKKRKAKESEEMKENESAPSPVSSSTVTTPKLKNMKSALRDSVPSPLFSASSTATTPQSIKKKKNKKKNKGKEGVNSDMKTEKMVATLNAIRRKSLEEERMEADREHIRAIESGDDEWPTTRAFVLVKKEGQGDDEWPTTRAFVPVKKEGQAERQRLKKETKMKMKSMERSIDSQSTVPKPAPDTVPATSTSRPAVPCPKIGDGTVSMQAPHTTTTVLSEPRPTTKAGPVSSNGTLTVPSKPAGLTVPYPNGTSQSKSGANQSKPKHFRFVPDSPVQRSLPNNPTQPSIDNGRSTESPSDSTTLAAASVEGERRMNGRVKRFSSPEISTTSSDSSGDEKNKKEEENRKKRLTKKPEVTSSKASTSKMTSSKHVSTSKMTSSTPVVSPKTKLEEKSTKEEELKKKGLKKKLKKKNKGDGKTANVPEPKEEIKEEEEEKRLRPSSDLLQMVAARLANSHGILVFRLISRETRRIAEQQLRNADTVLHLDEFDDENAFTRDDMAQWWEGQREAEDTTVGVGKENRSHEQVSAFLNMRAVEKKPLRDMDGGMSHPSSAASAVDSMQLLQHPLETLDAACLLHESQAGDAARLMRQEGRQLREVWLGHNSANLVRELKRLTAIELFEHRQATMETLEKLPLLQITDLRVDIVDDGVTRSALADHLVNGQNLRALQLNIAPTGPLDGNTASHYTLFTKRSYDRGDYTDDLEWMIPNVEDGEPDPMTLCMPSLEHLATNVANVKLLWQLRDSTLLLRHLLSLRVGTLSTTRELITSSELFADTKESRKHKQPGFFALRDAYETVLESLTLRLGDRVGVSRLQRETATLFESICELPPSLRRLSLSLFYNQFSGVCAPFRKWTEPDVEAPDTDHIGVEEMNLHFERAFDLRGLPALLPRTIKKLSIAVNYENEEDARCLGSFMDMLPGLERLESLEDLHIQIWGVRCLQPLVASVAACSSLAARLKRLAVAAYPVDDEFFEGDAFPSWLRSFLSSFPLIRTIGLHASVLVRMVPEERRSGYSWRNGVAWLANERLCGRQIGQIDAEKTQHMEEIELDVTPALPILDDGEDYTITPHWEVEYNSAELVLSPENEEEKEETEDSSYSIPRGDEDSEEDDEFITDGEEEEEDHTGDASRDDLEKMEEGLEDETERIEKREMRRDEKLRAAMERGELKEGEEEEEGDLIDFDSISDEEEEEAQPRREFFDDEAAESDREESGDEEMEKNEESADSDCSSEDDDRQREEERREEEERRKKRMERKKAKMDDEVDRRKRKRVLESDEDEDEDMTIVIRRPINKKKKVIMESDDDE